MEKRIKSGLITASSIIGTAIVAVVVTPQWADFVVYLNDRLVSWGLPTAIIALIGVVVSEVWKQILNNRKMRKLGMRGNVAGVESELY